VGVVAELALTAERRERLRAYLDDEQQLRDEFPQVADYLTTASTLPGTDNGPADASFDVRLLHFMTGGGETSTNPYWDIVAPSVSKHGNRRLVDGGRPEGSARLAYAQMVLQAAYAYAIPSPETMDWMSNFCGERTVVELGAGRGYWAHQLSAAGVPVEAFELEPPDRVVNVSFPGGRGQPDVWHPVADVEELRLDDMADRTLFLCWPPGWGDTMASDALAAFEAAGGTQLVYVGEPKGGKTGDDAFFDALSDRWKLASTDPGFVSWWNLGDEATGWVRK
jgi:hypothetical protein